MAFEINALAYNRSNFNGLNRKCKLFEGIAF